MQGADFFARCFDECGGVGAPFFGRSVAGIGAPDGVVFEGGLTVGGEAVEFHAIGVGCHEEGDFTQCRVVDDEEIGRDEIGFGRGDEVSRRMTFVGGDGLSFDEIVVGLAHVAAKREDDAKSFVGELSKVLAGEEADGGFGEVEGVAGKFEIGRGFDGVGRDVDGREDQTADIGGEPLAETVSFETIEADGGVFAMILEGAPRKVGDRMS